MMLQLLRPVLMLITVLALCVGAVRVGYGLVYPMEAAGVFAMSECELPCWMGLEVGVTDWDTALLHVETFESIDADRARLQFRFVVYESISGHMYFSRDSVINTMSLRYAGCPLKLLTELGSPDYIENAPERHITLHYLDGATIFVNTSPDSHSTSISFQRPNHVMEVIAYNRVTIAEENWLSLSDPLVVQTLTRCDRE